MRIFVLVVIILIPVLCNSEVELKLIITEESIEYFNYINVPELNQYSIYVKLNDEYTKKFEKITSENIGNELTIIMNSTTLVKAKIQSKDPSGSFRICYFNSTEDSKKYMQKLLKNQYESKFYKPKPEDFEFKLSRQDSLVLQIYKDFINFDFEDANSKLSELVEISKNNSDDYMDILIDYLFISLRDNEYQKAQMYFDELNTLIDSSNSEGFEFYKKGGVIHIVILLGNNKIEEAQNLKIEFEKDINFSNIDEALKRLPYSYNGEMSTEIQQEIDDIDKALEVLGSLPYYSYICHKFGENEKAIESLKAYINHFSKNNALKDNSYYLLQLMYLCSASMFKEALQLSEQILTLDIKDFKYDTIQSKLWHSIILYNNDLKDEALIFYIKAKNEFNTINHPEDLILRILLTPYIGVFPSNDLYEDFDEIAGFVDE